MIKLLMGQILQLMLELINSSSQPSLAVVRLSQPPTAHNSSSQQASTSQNCPKKETEVSSKERKAMESLR
ncbi:unnamed protein product [Prunus armeniaca]|uniref:Uncharacterized protein n=1 Tax=Prunus armeniaca TaxID=36596 RepID=A0A6J5XLE3_PRUAR|nr:unnamed protein product [Prunus armeniaca]